MDCSSNIIKHKRPTKKTKSKLDVKSKKSKPTKRSLEVNQEVPQLTELLLTEPEKFRFYHRGIGRSSQIFQKKGESVEDYRKRKESFREFPGLIIDGEITRLVACVGCAFIGLSASPQHLKVCPQNARYLREKEIEIVKDFKMNVPKVVVICKGSFSSCMV